MPRSGMDHGADEGPNTAHNQIGACATQASGGRCCESFRFFDSVFGEFSDLRVSGSLWVATKQGKKGSSGFCVETLDGGDSLTSQKLDAKHQAPSSNCWKRKGLLYARVSNLPLALFAAPLRPNI